MVEPDRNQNPSLLQYVKEYVKSTCPPGTELYAQHIHRLDRPVSGLVLFAKQRLVLKNLSEQFAERKVKKYYRALTSQAPEKPEGRFEHWHRKEKKKAALYAYEIEYSEKAELSYTVIPYPENRFIWNIELHTGKYHQIRAQLAKAGCPILGDELYGSNELYQPGAIALQAYRLVFKHPLTHQELNIKVEARF